MQHTNASGLLLTLSRIHLSQDTANLCIRNFCSIALQLPIVQACAVSMTKILEELLRLNQSERQAILCRLIELDAGTYIEETSEMLAAIDAGAASLEAGLNFPKTIAGKNLQKGCKRVKVGQCAHYRRRLSGLV